jgi:endoglucanase
MNEPQFDWLTSRSFPDPANKTRAFDTLNNLNQTFVDVVRETGGNNAYRLLLVPGYWTDIDMTIDNWGNFFNMPTDTIENRIILSLHYYTPWGFCGGNTSTWTNVTQLDNYLNKVKVNVLDKGIPVIIGEYGVNINNVNNQGNDTGVPKNPEHRANWLSSVTIKCIELGISPILWDTGMRDNNKGMADVQRIPPFNISANLNTVFTRLNEWRKSQSEQD